MEDIEDIISTPSTDVTRVDQGVKFNPKKNKKSFKSKKNEKISSGNHNKHDLSSDHKSSTLRDDDKDSFEIDEYIHTKNINALCA